MKNLMNSAVLTLSLTLTISATAGIREKVAQAFPVPGNSDVLKSLGSPSKSALPSKRLKFLVWNLHKGSEETFKFEYLALTLDRDIIMNQEIFLDENMLDVFKFMPLMYFTTATSFFDGKERIRTGVANISPVKPATVSFVRTGTLEPVIHSPKVTLITSYPISGTDKKLTIVNLHGINFVSNNSFEVELERIYKAIKNLPKPLVFAGDFNTWNNERLSILDRYKKKLGLSEAKFNPDGRLTFNGSPLDHFLYTSDLKIISARVDSFYKGSDHKPLQVEVEYSPSESIDQVSSKALAATKN
jgi:endonuclease/exonuclease/phosphatase (EEP) superfamily protein YafD